MTHLAKRSISLAIFGLGICAGFWGCIGLPMAIFTMGAYDSAPSRWAVALAAGTTLPACILALWHRRPAGLWLIALGIFLPIAMLYQRHFMITVGQVHQESVGRVLLQFAGIYDTLLAIGIFALVTEQVNWPTPLGAKSANHFGSA